MTPGTPEHAQGHLRPIPGPEREDDSRTALDAAIEAARAAIRDHWQESGGWSGAVTYDTLAATAIRAAEPILRKAIVEQFLARLKRIGYQSASAAIQYELDLVGTIATRGMLDDAEIAREVGRGE